MITIPVGRAGLIVQFVIPPVTVGTSELDTPVVKVAVPPEGKTRFAGGSALPVKVMVEAVVPYWLLAVTVKVVLGKATVGIPLIAQVVGFKVSPSGRAGLIVQLVIVPVIEGVILTETPTVKLLN